MNDELLRKYLRTRAVKEPWRLSGSGCDNYHAALVIPALAELSSLPATLASLATNPHADLKQTLVVVVINNRIDATVEQLQDNQATLAWLESRPCDQLNLVWVDASSPGLELPAKQGVGLARKIGFDLALPELDWSLEPLLISLDADSLVEQNYLPVIIQHFQNSCAGGGVLPFRHQQGENRQQEAAIRRYELYLRSYVYGLSLAGSPYAYHSIGSAIACRAGAYLRAGGMNRRLAAEDFYFLQQLAKTSGVELIRGTLVAPAARYSSRVPFGTGKAVREGEAAYRFISVAAFQILQRWLRLMERSGGKSAVQILTQAGEIASPLKQFIGKLDFVEQWSRICRNYSTIAQRQQAFHGWFDGLRTRQLLVQCDVDRVIAPEKEVAELLAWGDYPGVMEAEEQLRFLEEIQGV